MSEKAYLDLLREVLTYGEHKTDRTGTGTLSVFGGVSLRFDMREGFPLLTTKKVYWKSVWSELRWFLDGCNDVTRLESEGVRIWTPWKRADGTIGHGTYGEGWRNFPGIDSLGWDTTVDQLQEVIELLRKEPTTRRALVSAWNPARIDCAALPPCHYSFQFQGTEDGWLDISYAMRSNDLFLGAPFNIASYAALLILVAECVGMKPRFVIHNVTGDAHIYDNHLEAVELQLSRDILPGRAKISIRDGAVLRHEDGTWLKGLSGFDLVLDEYTHHPAIPAPIAV